MLPLRFIGVDGLGVAIGGGIGVAIGGATGTSGSPKKFKYNFVLYRVRDPFRGAEDIGN
jgi:hypothetical protein